MFLKLSILLALVFVFVQGYEKPYDLILPKAKECTKAGLMCDDCRTLVYCYQDADGDWIKMIAEYCTNEEPCNSSSNPPSCSANDECQLIPIMEHECYQLGTFPHPFDCTKYYTCTSNTNGDIIPTPNHYTCKRGYSYDPATTLCKTRLIEDKCTRRLAEPCTGPGRMTGVEGNPHLYSVCLSQNNNKKTGRANYFPHMFYCNDDAHFTGNDCIRPAFYLNSEHECTAPGQFYDPTDCNKYYVCDEAGKAPSIENCESGQKFNPITLKCESLSC